MKYLVDGIGTSPPRAYEIFIIDPLLKTYTYSIIHWLNLIPSPVSSG